MPINGKTLRFTSVNSLVVNTTTNAQLLDNKPLNQFVCSGCSWTCSDACQGSCRGNCTAGCGSTCTSVCTGTCSTICGASSS